MSLLFRALKQAAEQEKQQSAEPTPRLLSSAAAKSKRGGGTRLVLLGMTLLSAAAAGGAMYWTDIENLIAPRGLSVGPGVEPVETAAAPPAANPEAAPPVQPELATPPIDTVAAAEPAAAPEPATPAAMNPETTNLDLATAETTAPAVADAEPIPSTLVTSAGPEKTVMAEAVVEAAAEDVDEVAAEPVAAPATPEPLAESGTDEIPTDPFPSATAVAVVSETVAQPVDDAPPAESGSASGTLLETLASEAPEQPPVAEETVVPETRDTGLAAALAGEPELLPPAESANAQPLPARVTEETTAEPASPAATAEIVVASAEPIAGLTAVFVAEQTVRDDAGKSALTAEAADSTASAIDEWLVADAESPPPPASKPAAGTVETMGEPGETVVAASDEPLNVDALVTRQAGDQGPAAPDEPILIERAPESDAGTVAGMITVIDESDYFRDRYAAARRALAAGAVRSALAIYDELLARQPTDRVALLGRATALHRQGRTGDAIRAYEVVLSQYPDELAALTNLLGLIGQQAPETALQQLRRLYSVNPSFGAGAAQMAMIYAQLGDGANATRLMGEAAALAPRNAAYQINHAILLDHAGETTAAARAYERALMVAGSSPEGLPLSMDAIRERLRYLRAN